MLRSPICTILGHVNVGKTLLLDKLRNTNVQNKENGNITQNIGSSYINKTVLNNLTKNDKIMISGIILIDTPGHECFSHQRVCGLIVSDIVIILIDIIKGIDEETRKCIKMLLEYKKPFIICANKIDRINGWQSENDKVIYLKECLKNQSKTTIKLFDDYVNKIINQMYELDCKSALYYKNDDIKKNICIVPVSVKSGH